MATESAEVSADGDGIERPPFRGCVFCYGAEMTYYGGSPTRESALRRRGLSDVLDAGRYFL
ncbi:hypothetical protein ACFR9U_10520 [Halorientalis brevis]|uniref:Uncharacterized protein n=1 Tax=Halorientalis brevis TaxID=1126241 RepID=A0ABD6CDH3_9EURY|nr:hypothetical protein [Halorientalis brevis]